MNTVSGNAENACTEIKQTAESMPRDLFEDMRTAIGCSFISDLRFEPNLTCARKTMAHMEPGRYPLSQLKDMLSYLYGEKSELHSVQEAHELFQRKWKECVKKKTAKW